MRKRTNLGELCLLSVIVGCGNLRSPNSEGELGSSVGGSSVRKTKGWEGFRGREGFTITSMRKRECEIGDVAGWDWSTRRELRSRRWGSRCHRRWWQQKRLHCFFKEVKWSAVFAFAFACWVLRETVRERETELRVYFRLLIWGSYQILGVGLVGAPSFGIVCEPMDIWVHNLVG